MLSIQEKKEISNIFVAQIFLELLAIIFDTFLIDHTVPFRKAILMYFKVARSIGHFSGHFI